MKRFRLGHSGWDIMSGSDQTLVRADHVAMNRLLVAAERARIMLSSSPTTRIQVADALGAGAIRRDIDVELTQAQLEALSSAFINRAVERCRRALLDAKLDPSDVKEILMVAGQTKPQSPPDLCAHPDAKGVANPTKVFEPTARRRGRSTSLPE